jgi:neurofibromin 1
MQIMSMVMGQGARMGGLGGTGSRPSSMSWKYLEIVAGVTGGEGDLTLASAVCDACPPGEIDEVSLLMFRVFEANGNLLGLLKMLVEREVAQTSVYQDSISRQ